MRFPMESRVRNFVELLRSEGVSAEHPITPEAALKYRGLGPKTLPYLEELGLVRLDELADLPKRIGNLVERAGYKSRAEVAAAIEHGCFVLRGRYAFYHSSVDGEFHHLRNCGPFMYHQIRAWAGLDAPAPDAEI